MAFSFLSTKRSSLSALILSSSLIGVPALGLEVDVANPSGPVTTSALDDGKGANVIIKPTGHITNAATTVTIDSVHTLTIEADNVSASVPGLTTTGSNSPTVLATSQGGIVIGENSGIAHPTGYSEAVRLSGASNFSIDNAGSITTGGGGDTIRVSNSNNLTLVNRTGGTISAAGDDGISFGNSTNFNIINQTGATIETKGKGNNNSGIQFDNSTSGTISNEGIIQTQSTNDFSGAIYTISGQTTLNLQNKLGGTISSAGSHAIHNDGLAGFYTIDNAGTITGVKNAIYFQANNTGNFTNQSTGVITAGTGKASGSGLYTTGNYTGNLINHGTITGYNHGMRVNGTLTGTFTNGSTGVISVTNNTNGGNALLVNGAMTGALTNAGTLQTSNGSTVRLNSTLTGDFTNTGTISQLGTGAAPGNAVQIVGNIVGKFENQGTISTAYAGAPAILLSGTVSNGVHNSGNITGITGKTALQVSGTNYTQTAGTVTGDLILEGNNTATFTGGTVNGKLTLGGVGTTNYLNLENTTILGEISAPATNVGTLTVTNNFTTNNTIEGFENIKAKAGIFTINNQVTVGDVVGSNFTIDNGAQVILNNTLVGGAGNTTTINNNGTLNLTNNAILVNRPDLINDGTVEIGTPATALKFNSLDHTAAGNGTYLISISDTNNHSKIDLTAASDVTNDRFNTTLTGEGFIKAGDTFTIISNTAATTSAGMIIGQPDSLTVSFDNVSTANNIILSAKRTPFQFITNSVNADSAAVALDEIVNDPTISSDLKLAIAQIDLLNTQAQVSNAIESLLPDTTGGLVEISQDIFNHSLDTVQSRITQARSLYDIFESMPAGDELYYGLGFWTKAFASSASQKNIERFPGYKATTVGFSTGIDKSFSPNTLAGVAFTYTAGDVEGRQQAANELDIRSLQLTGYGSYTWGAFYLDGLVSAALNTYNSNRQVAIGAFTRTAKSNYKAWQYSGKFELGYTIANGKYRFEPIVGGQYSMLNTDGYTESTAGGISLAVQQRKVHDFIGSLGVRFSSHNEYIEALYVPEFRAFIHHDFIRDNIISTEHFVSNGAVLFETRSVKPDPLTYNLGAALTSYGSKVIFSANYDLTFRKQYIGHYGSFKFRYEW